MLKIVEAELPAVEGPARELLDGALTVLRRFADGETLAEGVVEFYVIVTAHFTDIMNRAVHPRTCAVSALVEWAGRAAIAPDDQGAAMCAVFALSNARQRDPSCRALESAERMMVGEGGGSVVTADLHAVPGGRKARDRAAALPVH